MSSAASDGDDWGGDDECTAVDLVLDGNCKKTLPSHQRWIHSDRNLSGQFPPKKGGKENKRSNFEYTVNKEDGKHDVLDDNWSIAAPRGTV